MNNKEFSDQFDVLYNNITSNQAPGLNEYEKSVFLTKAQSELVKNYFVPEGNPHQKGFDGNQKRQMDFSLLMRTFSGTPKNNGKNGNIDPRALIYQLPNDILYIVNESLNYLSATFDVLAIRQVVPLDYEEYLRLMSKPYKEPVKYQAWRLMSKALVYTSSSGTSKGMAPVIDVIVTSSDKKKYINEDQSRASYVLRYVKKPRPIILTDFSDSFGEDISIDGYDGSETDYSNSGANTEWEPCELDPSIHEEILQRAVELAKIAWAGEPAATVQAGQRSE